MAGLASVCVCACVCVAECMCVGVIGSLERTQRTIHKKLHKVHFILPGVCVCA